MAMAKDLQQSLIQALNRDGEVCLFNFGFATDIAMELSCHPDTGALTVCNDGQYDWIVDCAFPTNIVRRSPPNPFYNK